LPVQRGELTRIVLAVLFVGGLIGFAGWVLRPFLGALVWAVMIVVPTWPFMIGLQRRLGGRRWAAVTAMTVLLIATFLVPLLAAVGTVLANVEQIGAGAKHLADLRLPPPPAWVVGLPLVGDRIAEFWRQAQTDAVGVVIAPYHTLSDDEKRVLAEYFMKNIFRVLTPQAVDPARPFPYISNLSLNIGLTVESRPEDTLAGASLGNEVRFVRIKVPPVVPRLIPVVDGQLKFALVEEVIEANIHRLFPNMNLSRGHLFRVTRDADVEIRDDKAADLLALIKESLRERRFGLAVRLEVASSMPPEMVEYLMNSLDLEPDDVYEIDGLLDVQDLMELYGLNLHELKDKPLKAVVPPVLRNQTSIFDAIKKQDVLLHHPYSSFGTVVDFINAAANDPQVLAIKMCLYRTGKKSPIPQALIQASERGKQVTCVVEIKARFDEESNIEWAEKLAESGEPLVAEHARWALEQLN